MSSRRLMVGVVCLFVLGAASEAAAVCPDVTSPPATIPAGESLTEFAVETPVPTDVVLVSEAEFHRVLYDEGLDMSLAKKSALRQSIELGTVANHPNAIGVAGTYEDGLQEDVHADVFIVAQDPVVTDDGEIEATRFYIAAAENDGLGVDSVGTSVRVLSSGSVSTPQGQCNCEESPFCHDIGPGNGPGYCNDPIACPRPMADLSGLQAEFVDQSPTDYALASDECSPYDSNWQRVSGQYSIPIFAFNKPAGPDGPPDEPSAGGEVCRLCQQILCENPEFNPGDPVDNPSIPGICTGGGGDVPELCTKVFGGPNDLPPECQPHHAPVLSAEELGVCLGAGPPGNPDSGNAQMFTTGEQPFFPGCTEPKPRICQYVDVSPDSSFCSPEKKKAERIAWSILAGCGGSAFDSPIDGPQGLRCCEGNPMCGCTHSPGTNTETCMSCDDDGCTPVIRFSFLDPTVVETEASEDTDDDADAEPSDSHVCLVGTHGGAGFEFDVCNQQTNDTEQSPDPPPADADPDGSTDDREEKQAPPATPPSPELPRTVMTPPHPDDSEDTDEESKRAKGGRAPQTKKQASPFAEIVSPLPPRVGGGGDDDQGGSPDDEKKSDQEGEPVLVGTGALYMAPTDLSFPGPKMPLEFRRFYHSGSDDRGHLGSNWSHNWERRLQPLRPDTAPRWAARYCKEWYPFATCLVYHDGQGNRDIYMYDPETDLYKPPSGAFSHIRGSLGGGWILRDPDGTLHTFNASGYLTEVRDRFGNGFRVEQDATPLFAVYRRYCSRNLATDTDPDLLDPPLDSLHAAIGHIDPRLCSFMAAMFDDQKPLDLSHEGWQGGIDLPYDRLAEAFPFEDLALDPSDPTSTQLDTEARILIMSGRRYLKTILSSEAFFPLANQGARRYRPVRVVDDLGRSLEFRYEPYVDDGDGGVDNPVTAGLLAEVVGPADSRVVFSYARPASYPERLNESFLVEVLRTGYQPTNSRIDDSQWQAFEVDANPRRYRYDYQWPENVGSSSLESWEDGHADSVRDAYLAFYSSFLGCAYFQKLPCGGGTRAVAGGNACFHTEVAVEGYISTVADNLIFVERSGKHEVQSHFVADPFSQTFDRVTAQQYGAVINQVSFGERFTRLPSQVIGMLADTFTDSGSVGTVVNNLKQLGEFPTFHFDYVFAGPLPGTGIDRTELALPESIRDRYPMESGTFTFPEGFECVLAEDYDGDAACITDPDHDSTLVDETRTTFDCADDHSFENDERPPCDPGEVDELQRTLPGFHAGYEYVDPTPSPGEPELVRSRLGCEEIARGVLGNPFHNDNLSTMDPNPDTADLDDWTFRLVHGRRAAVEANHRRICQWTETTDRDGRITWHGTNFRGQTVATAELRGDGKWRFTDRFFNADGNLVEERWPEEDLTQSRTGWTEFEYEEPDVATDPAVQHTPAYWTRRANLIRVTEHPPDPVWNEDTNLHTKARSVRLTYEPLFNELQSVTRAHTLVGGSEVLLNETLIEFDYQELPGLPAGDEIGVPDSPIAGVLAAQIPWGLHFFHRVDETEERLNLINENDWITDYQFPMTMYGRDLNGDGILGFPTHGAPEPNRGKAVPVRVIQRDLLGSDPDRLTHVRWAPHGLPAAILEPNGRTTKFDYYALPEPNLVGFLPFGEASPPADADVSNQFKGLLARVHWNQVDPEYLKGIADCSGLEGPYRLLLRECESDPTSDLLALGLPDEFVDEILRISNGAEETVSFSYAPTGHTWRVWDGVASVDAAGNATAPRKTTIVRDSDGRPVRVTDPLGNVTTTSYTIDGWPFRSETVDSNGSILSQTRRVFDNEGRVLGECEARTPGACSTAFFPMPDVGTPSEPDQRRRLFRYSREGLLVAVSDSEGLVDYHDYDGLGRLVRTRTPDPAAPTDPARERRVSFEYDPLDRLVLRTWGTPETHAALGVLDEQFFYDGFHRLATHVDRRQTTWQHGYSARDERVATKQSDVPYQFGGDDPDWEVRSTYNGFSEIISRDEHGIITTDFFRTDDGRVFAQEATGAGRTWFGYDTSGRVIYTLNPFHDETVSVRNADTRVRATAELRRPRQAGVNSFLWVPGAVPCCDNFPLPTPEPIEVQGAPPLTTTRIEDLDANLSVLQRRTIAHGGTDRKVERWTRNGLGHVLEFVDVEGHFTRHTRNLLGWNLTEEVQRAPDSEVTHFVYNARGQQTELIDPSGQKTTTEYNGFGDTLSTTRPGSTVPFESWTYDGYGRADSLTMASGETLRFVFDPVTGDPIEDHWMRAPAPQTLLAEREFDELGRITHSTYYNLKALDPALDLGRTVEDVTVEHDWTYDPLDRVTSEAVTVAQALQTTSKYEHFLDDDLFGWERVTDRVWSGTQVIEYTDLAGKVIGVDRSDPDAGSGEFSSAAFGWRGDLYDGAQHAWASPFAADPIQELAEFDGYGQRTRWTWDGYVRDGSSIPPEFFYCFPTFDGDRCGDPILDIQGVRDVMGRLRGVTSSFGYPIYDLATFDPLPNTHTTSWRGYTYDEAGYFTREWTHDDVAGPPNSLTPNHVTNADVDTLGNQLAAEPWDRERELDVGGLVSISNANTGDEVWSATQRDPGHRLDQVELEGTTFPIDHDEAGRLTQGPRYDYVYDARGRLVAALDALDDDGVFDDVVELYLYDADGRLAHMERPETGELECYTYDGDHMIGAVDGGGNPLWEATWGPKQDQLIEYHDFLADDWYTLLRDHRNSSVGIHSQRNAIIAATAEYTAEGRLTTFNHDRSVACEEPGDATTVCPSIGNMPFAFNSMWRSPLTGLVYMRNRWYSPRLAQFTTHDPLGYVDLYTAYGFAVHDPINRWDPFGLKGTQGIPERQLNCMLTCGRDVEAIGEPDVPGEDEAVGFGKATLVGGGLIVITKANPFLGLLMLMGIVSTTPSDRVGPEVLENLEPENDAETRGMLAAAVVGAGVKGLLNQLRRQAGLLTRLRKSGLRPTQSAKKMNWDLVNKLEDEMKSGNFNWSKADKIIVSKDGAILDGHHKFVAAHKAGVKIPDSAIHRSASQNMRPEYDWGDVLQSGE